jgi:acyl-CoA-binding protein
MNIEETIKQNQGGRVLFLGRVTNFTPEELTNFLESQGMSYADKYRGEEIALVVLSTMLTPLEEENSYDLYDLKVPDVRLVEFEEFYTKHIKPNTLMMSLKLSNDQERLKRLLKNSSFTDEVFLKLYKMYDWGSNGVYDNDANRDATITFVERFYRPDGFRDPAMVYSPITLSNIARDAKRADILDAMLTMPNHEIKQSRKEDMRPKNLREIVALNQYISSENIRYLLSFNDNRIKSFLACNSAITLKEQEHIYTDANDITKVMLTQNSNLDDKIFKELLNSGEDIIKSLLTFQIMSKKRVEYILDVKLSDDVLKYLGENTLIEDVVESLIGLNKELDYQLASNHKVSTGLLTKLYETYGEEFMLPLSSNQNSSDELLSKFYNSNNMDVNKNLAENSSTDSKILKELCERNEHEVNRALALNPSVELFYLEQFALDSELIMLMSKNRTYLESVNFAHTGMRRGLTI